MAARFAPNSTRSRIVAGWLALMVFGSALQLSPVAPALDAKLLDEGYALLRRITVKPAPVDVVLIGIDEDTLQAFPEPVALWHGYLGAILRGLALAQPRAVGIDVELPERSYDFLRPGSDRELLAGMLALRAAAPLVIALGVDGSGRVKPVHAPFLAAAGEGGNGVAAWPLDPDGRVRRFDERLGQAGAAVPTLAGTLARRVGSEPRPGWLDMALGAPFDYIPAHAVFEWVRSGNEGALRAAFARRVVLLGSTLPFADRHAVAVPLAGWEPSGFAPGLLLHAQALRSLLGDGLVRSAPPPVPYLLIALAACVWLAFGRIGVGLAALAGSVILLGGLGLWLLHAGTLVPIAAALSTALVAATSRAGHDAWLHRRERERLRRAFGGYVSPNVLGLILRGELESETGSGRRALCVLFADIRNFTAMSERAAPEAVVAMLNAYFERMTRAIHACDGTVDNFRGDGIMCFFGAPQPTDQPCRQGFRAATGMLTELEGLNGELASSGLAALRIGISLAYGEAIVGRIGACERHEYTAIGDVANVSARLEGMTKELGYPLLVTGEVVAQLAQADAFDDLGWREIRGHEPVQVYGWPARASVAAAREIEALRAHHG
jgi:class 3 adenylate cyclase/CHASE2 domain-containing sensor protein